MANEASKGHLILIACAVATVVFNAATVVFDAKRDKRDEKAERRQEEQPVAMRETRSPHDASGDREDKLVDFRKRPALQ